MCDVQVATKEQGTLVQTTASTAPALTHDPLVGPGASHVWMIVHMVFSTGQGQGRTG